MSIYAKMKVMLLCLIALLIAGCGGDGSEEETDMSDSAFIGRWEAEDSCVKNVDASGASYWGWHRAKFEFTSKGELNLVNSEYLDSLCIINWDTTVIPGFSWAGRGASIYSDGSRIYRLTLTPANPAVSASSTYKIALAKRSYKLCFSKNVQLSASSFGVSASTDNIDTVDFNNCLVSSQ